jgi:enoyl-[acyl-carrier protein] reductase I
LTRAKQKLNYRSLTDFDRDRWVDATRWLNYVRNSGEKEEMMKLLEGKGALVFGVANHRSIAWGIARQLHAQGASVGITYADEGLRRHVAPLAEEIGAPFLEKCDLTNDAEIASVAEKAAAALGRIDILVHAVAYARKEDLSGAFSETSRKGFRVAMEISCYSLVAVTREALPFMSDEGSVITLTYYGGEKVAPNYNVMGVAKAALESATRYLAAELGPRGIRVNAISAGPVRTLSAAGVSGFKDMYNEFPRIAPMRRHLDIDDVGSAAVWLASDLSRNTTGQTLFVDGGYSILATPG